MDEAVLALLHAVREGRLTPDEAERQLTGAREADLGFAVLDQDRLGRTGLAEVVYGEGKTASQIEGILRRLNEAGQPALVTRVDPSCAAAVVAALPGTVHEPVPRLLWRVPEGHVPFQVTVPGPVWVVSAGTSDLPVAEEAARCAAWFGLEVHRAVDVGVAGLHRLLARLEGLRQAKVVIAVAGMEGALPPVVAGLVRAPVIAVPTSVGYGAAFGGVAPLLSMLTACAPGIGVVNIDNGFGAALLAWRIRKAAS